MKLKAVIDDREEELTVRVDGGRVTAEIGDRVYDLELREPEPGSYLFFRTPRCLSAVDKADGGFEVNLWTQVRSDDYRSETFARGGQDADRHHHGLTEITAPMPGKVVRVLIEVGDS